MANCVQTLPPWLTYDRSLFRDGLIWKNGPATTTQRGGKGLASQTAVLLTCLCSQRKIGDVTLGDGYWNGFLT